MSVRIIQGDVRDELPKLPADSFDCIVTSPPYYGLRDYGTATWEGGDPECDHKSNRTGSLQQKEEARKRGEKQGYDKWSNFSNYGERWTDSSVYRGTCSKCGARRIDAQIGLEPTLDAYLETMVAVCRQLRRVLKPSGVFFINIGDSYNSSSQFNKSDKNVYHERTGETWPGHRKAILGIKHKDLCLVPERLGIALQADGWWVRSHIIWAKPNPMPESCQDRPTSAHETIWLLTKSPRYFWDGDAVKEEGCGRIPGNSAYKYDGLPGHETKHGLLKISNTPQETRNLRNVWSVASHPFPGAHFATMPPEIAERCIKAGSSERGCCPACGEPWARITGRDSAQPYVEPSELDRFGTGDAGVHRKVGSVYQKWLDENPKKTIGWQPSCECRISGLIDCMPYTPIPSRILDPFAGAGTTGLVADRLGRDATLIDINTSYIDMAVNRIRDDAPLFAEVAAE